MSHRKHWFSTDNNLHIICISFMDFIQYQYVETLTSSAFEMSPPWNKGFNCRPLGYVLQIMFTLGDRRISRPPFVSGPRNDSSFMLIVANRWRRRRRKWGPIASKDCSDDIRVAPSDGDEQRATRSWPRHLAELSVENGIIEEHRIDVRVGRFERRRWS